MGLKKTSITKGVAKLGYSWEAMDVNFWTDVESLANGLEELVQQPGNIMDFCHVQEWVDIDVEMRHFVVLPPANSGYELPKIEKIVYTAYESKADNHFSSFNRFDRNHCVSNKYKNDSAALQDAENKAQELIHKLYFALRGECSEIPPVIRFDVLAKRTGPGKSKIMIGEITELGACFLGWPQGPKVVFNALIKSCL